MRSGNCCACASACTHVCGTETHTKRPISIAKETYIYRQKRPISIGKRDLYLHVCGTETDTQRPAHSKK